MPTVQDRARVEPGSGPLISDEYDVIVDRLMILHPTLDVLEIRKAVADATDLLKGARLQMFVPLLVEKIARDECRRLASGPA